MPKRTDSITRVVLFFLSIFTSIIFVAVAIYNITDDRVIVGVISLFSSLVSGVAGFFFGSQQPENKDLFAQKNYENQ